MAGKKKVGNGDLAVIAQNQWEGSGGCRVCLDGAWGSVCDLLGLLQGFTSDRDELAVEFGC